MRSVSSLPIDRVFAAPGLNGPVARGVELSPDGAFVTFLQGKPDDPTALDLWAVPTSATGGARLLVDSAAVTGPSAGLSEAELARRERQRTFGHGIVEYRWDDQGARILVPVAGELFLADVATGAVTLRVGRGADGGDCTDARFSPRGEFISFVRNAALFVVPTLAGEARQVTPAAHDTTSYAVAEFVAQEEFARDTGYWWSPDDSRIAYTRVDESMVDPVRRIDIAADGTTIVDQRYPFAGTANARVDLFIASLAGGAPVPVDLGADTDIYLARVHWSADGGTLYVQRQSRDQRTLDLLAVDPASGASRVILSEQQSPWVNITVDFVALDDGGFLWVSSRTGFAHLYHYDRNANLVGAVTSGDFPLGCVDRAPAIVGVDQARGPVYVMASKDTPLEQHLYCVDYRSGGPMQQITQGGGWWTVRMGRLANAFVGSFSSPSVPPCTGLYDCDGRLLRWIVDNPLDAAHPYAPFRDGLPVPEFGELTAQDGQILHYVLIKPVDFDPARRYPAVVQVYGGPGRQMVKRDWRPPSERLLLEAGFVLFQLDNRGSANRGMRFEAPVFGQLGVCEVADQITGLRFLQSLPYIDGARVGVTGWSFGGFMTLHLMTEPGSGFAAGAAGAAPSGWRMYDTHYTEHYMGHPDSNVQGYDACSVLPRLDALHGRLLLLHGMADDNVLFDNAVHIMARLQQLAKPFDLMLYPGQRHGIVGAALNQHLWQTIVAFFQRELQR